MARTSKISDPGYARNVAHLYINENMNHQEIAAELEVHRETVGIWLNDPRVKVHCTEFADERVAKINRAVDKAIEKRIQDADVQEDVELLLKIRKEFMGNAAKVKKDEGPSADTINDAINKMEDDPEFAEQLSKLLG